MATKVATVRADRSGLSGMAWVKGAAAKPAGKVEVSNVPSVTPLSPGTFLTHTTRNLVIFITQPCIRLFLLRKMEIARLI